MGLKPKMETQEDHAWNVKAIAGNDYGAVLIDVSTTPQRIESAQTQGVFLNTVCGHPTPL
jgi:hypothetical protein